MIDKKPFRVTNEQAKNTLSCNIADFEREPVMSMSRVNDYAADLLDARELIDKQEALIKEMREGINDMAVNPGGAFMLAKVTELLDKTKDYA